MSFAIRQIPLLREGRRPRVWSVAFPDPASPLGVREDDAVGMVANVAIGKGVTVRNDFDNISIYDRPMFNATWDAVSRKWVDLVRQGEEGFSWCPTQERREVLYRCRPFWYRLSMNGDHRPDRISVTDRPLPGYTLAPMFKNGEDFVYRPVFTITLDENGMAHSRLVNPKVVCAYDELLPSVKLFDPKARTESVLDWFSEWLLLIVEFARWDVGTLMPGRKVTFLHIHGDAVKGVTASSGAIAFEDTCIWRGKENAWRGANSTLCDLLLVKESDEPSAPATLYYLPDPLKYTGVLNEHYVPIGSFCHTQELVCADVTDFAMSSYGFLYPAAVAQAGVHQRCGVFYNGKSAAKYPILVSVGGSSESAMFPLDYPPSPLNWECIQRYAMRGTLCGGRLVLDEGV